MRLLSLFGKHLVHSFCVIRGWLQLQPRRIFNIELIASGASPQVWEATASLRPNACKVVDVVKPDDQTLGKVISCHREIQLCSVDLSVKSGNVWIRGRRSECSSKITALLVSLFSCFQLISIGALQSSLLTDSAFVWTVTVVRFSVSSLILEC